MTGKDINPATPQDANQAPPTALLSEGRDVNGIGLASGYCELRAGGCHRAGNAPLGKQFFRTGINVAQYLGSQ